MIPSPALVALRGLVMVTVVAVGGTGLWAVAWPALTAVHGESPLTFVDVFVALCALLTALSWAWLQLIALLVAAAALAGACRRDRLAGLADRLARATAPGAVRRRLLAACGVALSTGALSTGTLSAGAVALPAVAMTATSPYPPTVNVSTPPLPGLAGLPLPDRAVGDSPRGTGWITVRPGDSLWAIACRLLPRDADDQEISATWHQLALANRAVLGSDPDLIHPGTRLRVPARRRDGM